MALSFFEWLTLSPKEQILVNHFDQQQEEMLKKQMRAQQAAEYQRQEQAFYAQHPDLYRKKLEKDAENFSKLFFFVGSLIFFLVSYFLWNKTSIIRNIFSILSAAIGLILLVALFIEAFHINIQPKEIDTEARKFVKEKYPTFTPNSQNNEVYEIVYESLRNQIFRDKIEYIATIKKYDMPYIIAFNQSKKIYQFINLSSIIQLRDNTGKEIFSPQVFFANRV